MARICVSLSNQLKARLDGQVAKEDRGVSKVVQAALEFYFQQAMPTPSEPLYVPGPEGQATQASLPLDFLERLTETDHLAA